MSRRIFAALAALVLLTAVAGRAYADEPGDPPDAESSVTVDGPESPPAEEPPAGGETQPPQTVSNPVDDPPPVQSAEYLPPPAVSDPVNDLPSAPPQDTDGSNTGEQPRPLSDRLLLPLAAAVVLLLAAVVWLLWDRSRSRGGDDPGQSAPRPDIPVTRAPGGRPVYQVGNLQNIGRREEQQDSFCLSDIRDQAAMQQKGLLAVVADGMGGLEGGAAISQLVTDTFLARYRQLPIPDPAVFLHEGTLAAEEAVERYMARSGVNGGSTLVSVLLRDGQMHYISVGDSRIYLLRDGTLHQINREHTYGALLQERAARGEVDPEEPYINPRRNALTAYIGMGRLRRIDRSEHPIPLQPGDKVLLCSDGVFNALDGGALCRALAGPALDAAQRLEEAVLAQHHTNQDNFTAVILEWRES